MASSLEVTLTETLRVLHQHRFACYIPHFANTAPFGLHFVRGTPRGKQASLELVDWNRPFAPAGFTGPFFFYAQWDVFKALKERARGGRRGGAYYHEVVSRYRIREMFLRRSDCDDEQPRDAPADIAYLRERLGGQVVEVYSDTKRQAREVLDVLDDEMSFGKNVYRMFENDELFRRIRSRREDKSRPAFIVSGPLAKLLAARKDRFVAVDLPDELFGATNAFDLLACWFLPNKLMKAPVIEAVRSAVSTYHEALFAAAQREDASCFRELVKGYHQLARFPIDIFETPGEYAECLARHHTYDRAVA